ncbi:response regulator [Paenibacillus sp. NPDC058174]|uniref:response regulator n=1 Tax=Paenibacillus sp. NPDC058174 TaxID=3346366 RepID=UPI0036DEE43C
MEQAGIFVHFYDRAWYDIGDINEAVNLLYKVMIVEDELLVRVGLKNSIPWHQYEMEVVADVSNGQEALELFRSHELDLIITDLKMPVMDGLELISTVRAVNSDIKILILSCIEEFEYARRAAGLNVSGYMLKLTMSLEEMGKVLETVRQELAARKPVLPGPLNHPLTMKMLKGKLIKDNIFYGVHSSGGFEAALKQLDGRIQPGKAGLALLETNQYSRLLKRFNDERGELIHFTISNILDEILNNHHAGEAWHDSDNRYLIMFSYPAELADEQIYDKISEVFAHIQRAMNAYLDIPVFMGVSTVNENWYSMRGMYEECKSMLENRFFSDSFIQFASEREQWNPEPYWKRKLLSTCDVWRSLGQPYYKDLQAEMSRRLEQPIRNEPEWRRFFIDMLNWMFAYLGIPKEHAELLELSGLERINAGYTMEACVEAWEQELAETAKMKDMIKTVSQEVEKAVHYIHQHYDEDISLKDISEYVQLSPNYLSLLFKKSMGRNLTEYLTDYRIEKAKDLLLNTTLKTYEVAENVGVPDSAYFSRIFKKMTGISPLEFRKKKVLYRRVDSNEDH